MTWLTNNIIENSTERHKITILRCNPALSGSCIQQIRNDGYPVLDAGYDIAKFITSLTSLRYLPLDVHDYFQKLIRDHSFSIGGNIAPAIILHNIGILFEQELQLKVSHLLIETAKAYHVILIWDGDIIDSKLLTWHSDEIRYSIDLTHIPLKIQNYEI